MEHGPRYKWHTDKGKNGTKTECFGMVMDMGANYPAERPHPKGVLVYGPYTGRGCVSKAAQVASDAARVLNEGVGLLPAGEPLWTDNLERVPDPRICVLTQQIARVICLKTLTNFQHQVMTENHSPWQMERTWIQTDDGAEYQIDIRRVK